MGAAVSTPDLIRRPWSFARRRTGEAECRSASDTALALVLDGVDRKTAAETCGMDR
jgi:hypothetical protein